MKQKLIIIEDNKRNLELFTAVLELIPDIDIVTETRGRKGFDLIKSIFPDLIILDVDLPDMNGIDICIELRKLEKFKKTPIIAVTSFAMKGDKERIMQAGFNEYFSKPIKISEFREVVKNYLKKES
jgi:two-component system cell cycle response regulator DivK